MINIPIKATFKGKFRWELIDEKTGEIKDKSDGYIDNMITKDCMNTFFENNNVFLDWYRYGQGFDGYALAGTMNTLRVGSGTTPETRDDTSLENQLSGSPNQNNSYDRSTRPTEFPVWIERQFIFNAGNVTGIINEIATFGSSYHGFGMTARKVLDTPIEKTDTDKLIVYYRHEFDIPQRHYSGTITGGQRDGTTDINWDIYITDDMVYRTWCSQDLFNTAPFAGFVGLHGGYTVVRMGDSNAPSDIKNDSGTDGSQLKGNQIYSGGVSFRETDDYIADSFQRSGRVGWEENVANGQIAEMLFFPRDYSSAYATLRIVPAIRVTFDPPLDNVANYRLYLDFSVSLGSAT
jgi:hypothetical protein